MRLLVNPHMLSLNTQQRRGCVPSILAVVGVVRPGGMWLTNNSTNVEDRSLHADPKAAGISYQLVK